MPDRITELELLLDAATEAIGKYMQDNEKLYRENERLKKLLGQSSAIVTDTGSSMKRSKRQNSLKKTK